MTLLTAKSSFEIPDSEFRAAAPFSVLFPDVIVRPPVQVGYEGVANLPVESTNLGLHFRRNARRKPAWVEAFFQ
jgi:hypothetical protein